MVGIGAIIFYLLLTSRHLPLINYRPRNHQELFNLRHARLRNVIERIFGVLKRRFKVLLTAQEYSFATQAQITSALAALHNFNVTQDPSDIPSNEVETKLNEEEDAWGKHYAAVPREERTRAAECRDRIAKAMWEEYVTRPQRRRR
jgi:hypothetical protein